MADYGAWAGLGNAIGEGSNAFTQARAAKNAALMKQQQLEAEQNKDTISPEMAQAFAKANGQKIDLSMFAGQRVPASILRPMGMYGAAGLGANAKIADVNNQIPLQNVKNAGALNVAETKPGALPVGNGSGGAGGDIFAGLPMADRKMMGQIISGAQQINETSNKYKNNKLDTYGSAGVNSLTHMLPAFLAGPVGSRLSPDVSSYNQQNELLTDQLTPLFTANPKAAAATRESIRKNVMVEPGTPQADAADKFAQMYRDIKDRLQSQGRISQPMANMLDEIIAANGTGQMDQVIAKYHGLIPSNPGGATAQNVTDASTGNNSRDIEAAQRVVKSPDKYKPEHVAQAKAILGIQ